MPLSLAIAASFTKHCFMSKEHSKYHFHMPATLHAVSQLLAQVEKILTERQVRQDLRNNILLITEEALVNIVNYAYKNSPIKDPQFECLVRIQEKEKLYITFKDQGAAFDFQSVQSPNIAAILNGQAVGGFGIHLIKSLADHVRYKRKSGVNTLDIEKSIV